MLKMCIVAADGFETIEALTQMDFLRRAGVDTYFVSADNKDYIKSDHDVIVKSDMYLADAEKMEDWDGVFIPGGYPNAISLRDNKNVTKFVKKQFDDGKLVASICAGPMVLEKAGILKDKKATVYPGLEDSIASADVSERIVVRDGNIITAQGPAISPIIAYEIIEYLFDITKRKEIEEDTLFDRLPLN